MTAGEREAMIVARAISVVAQEGFDLSVRDLAKRIGVPHSVLFRHFPTKAALSKRIYDEVFVSRLSPEWPLLLADETVSLADRLLRFYRAYTAAIFSPTWVRIFLFAGLKGTPLNTDYFAILNAQVLEPICAAVRRHVEQADADRRPPTAGEMERAWGLHGRIVYLAIRQHVYRRPVPASIDALLGDAVAAFLDEAGRVEALTAPAALPSAVAPVPVATHSRRMSADLRVRAIIEGAVTYFARHGINGQMRELARHLGITHSLLFHYFPRKQDLVDQVYVDVFERPWQAVRPHLRDDGRPLAERLIAFYRDYLAIVDRAEWIRIFISAGLHDVGLCARYLDLVECHVIDVVAEAARHAIDAPSQQDCREHAWGLHGQIVYSAIRNHIYGMPTLSSQQAAVEAAVALFLASIKRRSLLRVRPRCDAERTTALGSVQKHRERR